MSKITKKVFLGIAAGMIMILLIGSVFVDMSDSASATAKTKSQNNSTMNKNYETEEENKLKDEREKEEARILEKERIAREEYKKESIEIEKREKEAIEAEKIRIENEKIEAEKELAEIQAKLNEASKSTENIKTIVKTEVKEIQVVEEVNSGNISGSCAYLKENYGIGDFKAGDANYTSSRDRDNDGVACDL